MKTSSISIQIEKPFGNLFRDTIVLVVKNTDNRILLGAKPYFFPPGITRVLGGGIMQNESIIKAAQRELKEELTINVSESDLLHVETLEVNARDKEENSYKSKVNFVIVTHSIDSYTAGDDVISIDVLTEVQLNNLIRLYENLPETLWYRGEEGEFCWKDYGKMYSPVHKIVKDIAYRTH